VTYLKNADNYRPGSDRKMQKRLDWFVAFNKEAMGAGCWVISTPSADVTIL
jgi:hypothetical protein